MEEVRHVLSLAATSLEAELGIAMPGPPRSILSSIVPYASQPQEPFRDVGGRGPQRITHLQGAKSQAWPQPWVADAVGPRWDDGSMRSGRRWPGPRLGNANLPFAAPVQPCPLPPHLDVAAPPNFPPPQYLEYGTRAWPAARGAWHARDPNLTIPARLQSPAPHWRRRS